MRVFKTKAFARFSKQEGITDEAPCDAIRRAEKGLIDADLGGDVIKQRLAREGQRKSGATAASCCSGGVSERSSPTASPRRDQATIRPDELTALRTLADVMLGLDDESRAAALMNGTIVEIRCHG
ncbi:MAG: type II toxin-antitoxin system RelE/ParE family toxin [Rhodospirillales bacterium]|nr:type II toxin-antitoxin system RelE/ParE family toxin [Rhodospirillales bacterium]